MVAGQRELDPNGLWFNDSSVARVITSAFQQYFLYPWRNYSEVDSNTREQWFNLFMPNFTWRPELEFDVRRGFDHRAGIRPKDLHNYVTKKGGVCPKWMPTGVHEQMIKNTQDETFQAKSKKAQKNRRGGDLASAIPPSHCQGSISVSERARRLAAKSGGVLTTAAALSLDTHFREEPGKGKVPVSDKAKKVKETYDKNVAEGQKSGVQNNLNQIFFDTVGGRKKGKVHGLGTSADLYYEMSSRRTDISSTTCTPSIVSQLSRCLDESERARAVDLERKRVAFERERLEMERERMQWQKEREEERQREREYVEEMKRILDMYDQMFSQCSGSLPFTHPRDPRNPPDPSGTSGACVT